MQTTGSIDIDNELSEKASVSVKTRHLSADIPETRRDRRNTPAQPVEDDTSDPTEHDIAVASGERRVLKGVMEKPGSYYIIVKTETMHKAKYFEFKQRRYAWFALTEDEIESGTARFGE
ncbi:hypothetical protein [Halomarina oriensis]|uniref:Uncharacterized protein n=1 Tax=Halomarina oriensis TaxID=671145 RepID=A0A6B0GIL6_9EURY|nr:hypothetical protein [Halomarina oriensis]MWG34480.1 hypothetical protein [Halomarina oriensis]